jgi:hypothetical protein
MKINKNSLLAFPILIICTSLTFGQNYRVDAYSFSSGFGISETNNIKVNNSLGQSFVGKTDNGNSSIISGALSYSGLGGFTDVEDKKINLPDAFELRQNYPNPFNPSTKIEYDIPQNSFVEIKVYDVTGRELNVLVKEEQTAGNYIIEWKPEGIGSGIYFCRITAFPSKEHTGGFLSVRKMIYLK